MIPTGYEQQPALRLVTYRVQRLKGKGMIGEIYHTAYACYSYIDNSGVGMSTPSTQRTFPARYLFSMRVHNYLS